MSVIIERDGKWYCVEGEYEWEYTPPSHTEQEPSLEQIQTQTLLNTEYLVIMSELSNL